MENNCWAERMIKKAITEAITEQMFRDLGFYVIKFGQENTINPLIQLEYFIKICKGEFHLEKEDEKHISPITYAKKMPDFIVVDKNGKLEFVEVKFRHNAKLWFSGKDGESFETYLHQNMLIINTNVADDFEENIKENEELYSSLKNTRFHMWKVDPEKTDENGFFAYPVTLKEWLKRGFGIENDEILNKYEKLVTKWLSSK